MRNTPGWDWSRLLLATLLWIWFTLPVPQIVTLYRRTHNRLFIPLSPESVQALTTYYCEIAVCTIVLSIVGPVLIWAIIRRWSEIFSTPLVCGAGVGFVLSETVALVIPAAREAGRAQGSGTPTSFAYFILATVLSGLIASYLAIVASGRAETSFSARQRFVGEGIVIWLAVLRIPVGVVLGTLSLVGSELIQLVVGFPALFWAAASSLLLWKVSPRSTASSMFWAISIGLLVSKIAGWCIYYLGLLGFPGGLESWIVARLDIPSPGLQLTFGGYVFDMLMIFGPAILWGLIMGLRRRVYQRRECV